MEEYVPIHNGRAAIQFIQDKTPQLTLSTYIAVLIFSCIATRFISGVQSRRRNALVEGKPLRVRKAPYWLPYIGHTLSPERGGRKFISYHVLAMNEPIVALKTGNSTQNMVLSPSIARHLLSHPAVTVEPFHHRAMEKIFGDRGMTRKMDDKYRKALDAAQLTLFREPYITQLSKTATDLIQQQAANLISFNRRLVDQAVWERDGDVTVVDGSNPPVGEAKLFSITRNFMGWITTSLFLGKAFVDLNPTFWEDMWIFGSQFLSFASGVPPWLPLPGISAAYAARERLIRAIAAFEAAFRATDDGVDPGIDYRDMEDVSEVMTQRMRVLREAGYSVREAAHVNLAVVCSMHLSVSNLLFWSLLHSYQEPKLLSAIRDEVAPFVKAERLRPEDTGFPISEPPRVSFELGSLLNMCPLLKATYFETLRLHTDAFSYRQLLDDLLLTESAEDANIFGSTHPRPYQLRKGDVVVVPHGVHQIDGRFFEDPQKFDPHRFILTDPETGRLTADMKTMIAFGDGSMACKGRVIFDCEILSAIAAIISLWEIEAVDEKGWKIPRRKFQSDESIPVHDVRVRMKHRI